MTVSYGKYNVAAAPHLQAIRLLDHVHHKVQSTVQQTVLCVVCNTCIGWLCYGTRKWQSDGARCGTHTQAVPGPFSSVS